MCYKYFMDLLFPQASKAQIDHPDHVQDHWIGLHLQHQES
jgi:hypothetical protein